MRQGGGAERRVAAFRRRVALFAALSVAGCTIFAPIQEPQNDRRFPLKIQDTEQIPCVDPVDGRSSNCQVPLKTDLDKFAGDLGRQLWQTDMDRRSLAAKGMEKAQLNNAYNALLWPLGAFFIAKKIHHPEWSTLDTAAVAAASYGVLSSGVPDRDKLFMRTSDRMACMMVAFEPLLYLNDQFDVAYEAGRDEPRSLEGRVERLKRVAAQFKIRRDALLAILKARAGKAGAPGDPSSIAATRAQALGKKTGGGGVAAGDLKTFLEGFLRETDRLHAEAITLIGQAEEVAGQIRDSGRDLAYQRLWANRSLNQALAMGTGEAVSPEARARQIVAMVQTNLVGAKAFSERIATLTRQSGSAQESTWTLTAARLQELDETSQQKVLAFWTEEGGQRQQLIVAQDRLKTWMDAHRGRAAKAAKLTAEWHCSDGAQDEFSKQLLKVVSDASAAAAAAAAAQASGAGK